MKLWISGPDLSGLWVKQTKDDFSNTLYIDGSIFSFSEGIEIRDFLLQVEEDVLVLSTREGSAGKRTTIFPEGE